MPAPTATLPISKTLSGTAEALDDLINALVDSDEISTGNVFLLNTLQGLVRPDKFKVVYTSDPNIKGNYDYNTSTLTLNTENKSLKSFDDMHRLSFYTGIVYGENVEVAVGIIGSIPNHPILIDYLSNIKYQHGNESVNDIFNTTGPYYFTKIFLRNVDENTKDIVAFPTIYFYPFHTTYHPQKRLFGFDENDLNIINKHITEDSYATHWWHVSWNK
jgi:hypothetical protein